MKPKFLHAIIFTCILNLSFAQESLKITGKLRVLKPTLLELKNINGETLFSTEITSGKDFELGSKHITPDVYKLYIGDTEQLIYLKNTEVTITGFYNNQNPENSSLNFTGIDDYLKLLKWIPQDLNHSKRIIDPEAKNALHSDLYAALAFLSDIPLYEPNKMILDWIPENKRNTLTVKWLINQVDSLAQFSRGAKAYDFNFPDDKGNCISLSDFKGKFILVDFWASWCGPCRHEAKNLRTIYNELKGDDLEFISISLDKREHDWKKMLEEEQLPWMMLWNPEGFNVGDVPNTIQKAYGFYSIPFIVLIDKEGKIIERDIRGEEIKEAIINARTR